MTQGLEREKRILYSEPSTFKAYCFFTFALKTKEILNINSYNSDHPGKLMDGLFFTKNS
jgi:hypothetical protein